LQHFVRSFEAFLNAEQSSFIAQRLTHEIANASIALTTGVSVVARAVLRYQGI
jgi:hypothetical protein